MLDRTFASIDACRSCFDCPYVVPTPIDDPCLADVSLKTFLDTKKFSGKIIHQRDRTMISSARCQPR